MCGIAGLLCPACDSMDGQSPAAMVRRMAGRLHHRGPDSDGFVDHPGVSIGMTRLSIIDLETGDPPIANEDGTVWVVFNGEIYNYAERRRHLIAAGHRFKTQTDTEVIVHEYEEHGSACVEYFRGMFSFAIWDAAKNELFLARDRFGIKPLYVCESRGRLAFASEMKALLELPWVDLAWDADALSAYLRVGYTPADSTAYAGIRKLPPGSVATWSHTPTGGANRSMAREYWAPRAAVPKAAPPFAQALADVRGLLRESVRIRLRSDVPLGAFLSGGVDSSTIVAMMRLEGVEDLRTFSIGFEEREFNELPYADMVARQFRTRHHSRLVRASDAAAVPALLEQFDEPFADSSAIPTFYVSQLAREHVTVTLTGDGGDEVFAGYSQYRGLLGYRYLRPVPQRALEVAGEMGVRYLPEGRLGGGLVRRMGTEPGLRHLAMMGPPPPGFFTAALSAGFREFLAAGRSPGLLNKLFRSDGSPESAMLVDQRTYLVDDILTKVDRMSMAVSLEARVPLLDHVLAEYVNALPLSYKLTPLESKRILRRAVRGLVPPQVLSRRKRGFAVPLRPWLQGPLRGWCREVLLESCPVLLDEKGVRGLLEGLETAQRDFTGLVWKLLALSVWARRQRSGWQ
jgi:asparagine synthase (glutamine-hydrolysing)